MVCATLPLTVVGGVVSLYFLLSGLYFLYKTFLRPAVNLRKYGEWAVVTGATDGIGKEYAVELARKGLNVLLISRNAEKLAEAKRDVETASNNKVKVTTLAVDFSVADKATYQQIEKELKGIEVGILVNNVGVSYEHCEYFHLVDDQTLRNLVKINIESVIYMTKLVIPAMLEKHNGAIINISSLSGVAPAPLLSAYGASKAFVDYFSRMLAVEYKHYGLFIQSVTPAFVVTKMSGFRRPTLTIPTAKAYVRSALRTVGYDTSVAGFWAHDILRALATLAPESFIAPSILKSHLALRKKFLERKKANK